MDQTKSVQARVTASLSVPLSESMARSIAFFGEETERAVGLVRAPPADRSIVVDSAHALPELAFEWTEELMEEQERSFIDRTRHIQQTAQRLGCVTMAVDDVTTPELVAARIVERLGL